LQLFRRAAVETHKQRWLGDVQVGRAPGAGAAVLAALGVAALLGIALTLVEVPERVSAAGAMMPAKKLLNVHSPRAGVVAELAVANGERVERGQRLLIINGGVPGTSRSSPNRQRVDSLRRELALSIAASDQALLEQRSDVEALRFRQQLGREKLAALDEEVATRDAQLLLDRRRLQRVEELSNKGVLPAQSVDEQTHAVLQSRAARHATLQRQLELREMLASLARQLQQRVSSRTTILLRREREQESLERQILELEEQSATAVTAPGSGKVAGVLVQNGDPVAAGQRLLTVFEPDSELQAYLYISADDAGRIRAGQRIELQLQAFPYQLYGTLAANVVAVSAVPIPSGSLDIEVPIPGAVFEIRAALSTADASERDWLDRLGPGTSFRADLIANRWPLHLWLLGSGRKAV
jgi:membrane fusion protein